MRSEKEVVLVWLSSKSGFVLRAPYLSCFWRCGKRHRNKLLLVLILFTWQAIGMVYSQWSYCAEGSQAVALLCSDKDPETLMLTWNILMAPNWGWNLIADARPVQFSVQFGRPRILSAKAVSVQLGDVFALYISTPQEIGYAKYLIKYFLPSITVKGTTTGLRYWDTFSYPYFLYAVFHDSRTKERENMWGERVVPDLIAQISYILRWALWIKKIIYLYQVPPVSGVSSNFIILFCGIKK